MIVLLIIISYSGLLASSDNYLPFLNPTTYLTATNCRDCAVGIRLPSPVQFGLSCYTDAYVSIIHVYSMQAHLTLYCTGQCSLVSPHLCVGES